METDEADPLVNQTMYRVIIGSLLYLIANRPDIVFSIGMCARFQACPWESHLKATKRILRYVKKIGDLVLFIVEVILLNLCNMQILILQDIKWTGRTLLECYISLVPHSYLGEPKSKSQ